MRVAWLRGYELVLTLNLEDYREIAESMKCTEGIIDSYRGMSVQYGRFTSIGIKI